MAKDDQPQPPPEMPNREPVPWRAPGEGPPDPPSIPPPPPDSGYYIRNDPDPSKT
jgi:hypothetical protein